MLHNQSDLAMWWCHQGHKSMRRALWDQPKNQTNDLCIQCPVFHTSQKEKEKENHPCTNILPLTFRGIPEKDHLRTCGFFLSPAGRSAPHLSLGSATRYFGGCGGCRLFCIVHLLKRNPIPLPRSPGPIHGTFPSHFNLTTFLWHEWLGKGLPMNFMAKQGFHPASHWS